MFLRELPLKRVELEERLTKISAESGSEMVRAASSLAEKRFNMMVLWDKDLSDRLKEDFLREFLATRAEDDMVVMLRGNKIRDPESLYSEMREVVPFSDYMGSTLDSVSDILGYEALSRDPAKWTYWIWTDAHCLYAEDPDFFRRAFEVMAWDARGASWGYDGGFDGSTEDKVASPWLPWTPQPVTVLITGEWEVFAEDAEKPSSFIFEFPIDRRTFFRDLSTRFVVTRVSPKR